MLESPSSSPCESHSKLRKVFIRNPKIKTTRLARGLHQPFKGMLLADVSRRIESSANCNYSPSSHKNVANFYITVDVFYFYLFCQFTSCILKIFDSTTSSGGLFPLKATIKRPKRKTSFSGVLYAIIKVFILYSCVDHMLLRISFMILIRQVLTIFASSGLSLNLLYVAINIVATLIFIGFDMLRLIM